jgi:hypothetical protein
VKSGPRAAAQIASRSGALREMAALAMAGQSGYLTAGMIEGEASRSWA